MIESSRRAVVPTIGLMMAVAIYTSVLAQKTHERYDKFTAMTEVTSGRITVWKCGFLASACEMTLESFALKKNDALVQSGLRLAVDSKTGWYPNDSSLYVVHGTARKKYELTASKTEQRVGRVRTTLTYDIEPDDLRDLLSSDTLEMRIDITTFKVKDNLKKLGSLVSHLDALKKSEETANETQGVTLAGFNSLESGMLYSKAVRILGEPGVETGRVDVPGHVTVSYQWKAKEGLGNIIAMFQNGKLISKAQFGLR